MFDGPSSERLAEAFYATVDQYRGKPPAPTQALAVRSVPSMPSPPNSLDRQTRDELEFVARVKAYALLQDAQLRRMSMAINGQLAREQFEYALRIEAELAQAVTDGASELKVSLHYEHLKNYLTMTNRILGV